MILNYFLRNAWFFFYYSLFWVIPGQNFRSQTPPAILISVKMVLNYEMRGLISTKHKTNFN